MSIEKVIHWIEYANLCLPRQAENLAEGFYGSFFSSNLNMKHNIDTQNIAHEFYLDQKLIYCYYQKISKKKVYFK